MRMVHSVQEGLAGGVLKSGALAGAAECHDRPCRDIRPCRAIEVFT